MGYWGRSHKIVIVETAADFNRILDTVKKSCPNIYFKEKPAAENFGFNAYIKISPSVVSVSFKNGKKPIEYKFFLTGDPDMNDYRTGGESFAILSRYYKIQRLENPEMFGSASQLLYKNEKYSGKRVKAWSYDMNSAFGRMMLEPIPNIDTLELDAELKEGQIGFYEHENRSSHNMDLRIGFEVGRKYRYVCELMPSPFKKFVEVYFEKKKNASAKLKEAVSEADKEKRRIEKLKAKNVLNMCIGVLQLYNPLLRACIVDRCNKFIRDLIDSDTIYANTDCIVSVKPRADLEAMLGEGLGEFKLEHAGDFFAWQKKTFNYQWNLDIPVVRGVPKRWFKNFQKAFKRKYDILIDTYPDNDFNEYRFNKDKLCVEDNNLWQQK